METRGQLKEEELIKSLAKKYNVSFDETKKAVNSQFHFVTDKMKTLDTVRLPYFGVFKPNLKRKQQIDAKRKNKTNE